MSVKRVLETQDLGTHSSTNLIMLGGEVNNELPYEIRGLIFITHFFLIVGHDSMTLDLCIITWILR